MRPKPRLKDVKKEPRTNWKRILVHKTRQIHAGIARTDALTKLSSMAKSVKPPFKKAVAQT